MVAVEIDMKTRLALISWLVGQIHKRDNYVLCHKDDLLFLPNQKMVSEMVECSLHCYTECKIFPIFSHHTKSHKLMYLFAIAEQEKTL